MNSFDIPKELKTVIDSERIDFSVKSKRNNHNSKSVPFLLFGILWNFFIILLAFLIFFPLFKGEEVQINVNGESKTGSIDNLEPLSTPLIAFGVLIVVGIIILSRGLYVYFEKGGYFVGTQTRLIKYLNGEITITDWEQFTGNIKIKNKDSHGNIEFELRTGKMIRRENQSDIYIADTIYVSSIENVFDLEKKCRIRIKENAPDQSDLHNL